MLQTLFVDKTDITGALRWVPHYGKCPLTSHLSFRMRFIVIMLILYHSINVASILVLISSEPACWALCGVELKENVKHQFID